MENLFIQELKKKKFPLLYEEIKMQIDPNDSNAPLSKVLSEMKKAFGRSCRFQSC